MSGDAPESPIRTAVGSERAAVTEAFELLGSEIRLAIVLAVWEAYEPHGIFVGD